VHRFTGCGFVDLVVIIMAAELARQNGFYGEPIALFTGSLRGGAVVY
jgi:hypothetical protein